MNPCGDDGKWSLRDPMPSGTVKVNCLLDLSIAAVMQMGEDYAGVNGL